MPRTPPSTIIMSTSPGYGRAGRGFTRVFLGVETCTFLLTGSRALIIGVFGMAGHLLLLLLFVQRTMVETREVHQIKP